jgi:hypothetical protein
MYQPFIINLLIIAVILMGIALTLNPLFILGLLLLQSMPFIPPSLFEPEDDDLPPDESQLMGFTADIK